MDDLPLVSIVIPTLNSEKTLENCLRSVLNQTYDKIEIVIVDAGSEDRTIEIASSFDVKLIQSNIKSMSKQTNIGIKNSSGLYIYRIDSDVILPDKIVEKGIEKCENEYFDGVCIFWLPDESISFWAKVRKIEKESYIQKPYYVGSIKYDKNVLGARFLKRNVLIHVGCFDEEVPTSGEDYALYNKLANTNFQFSTINCSEMHIGEPKTINDIIKKNFHYGKDLMFFSNKSHGINQFSPIGRNYLISAFKRALNENIIIFFGLAIYLLIVYSSTGFGMLYFLMENQFRGKL